MKIGRLFVGTELRTLHTGRGFKLGCGVDYRGKYFIIRWNGIEKFSQILKLWRNP